jgi:hypothetical protein
VVTTNVTTLTTKKDLKHTKLKKQIKLKLENCSRVKNTGTKTSKNLKEPEK